MNRIFLTCELDACTGREKLMGRRNPLSSCMHSIVCEARRSARVRGARTWPNSAFASRGLTCIDGLTVPALIPSSRRDAADAPVGCQEGMLLLEEYRGIIMIGSAARYDPRDCTGGRGPFVTALGAAAPRGDPAPL